ncbi:MAG: hypothetical protein J6L81_09710 [Clostridia bacterium]|nr:hypothetical protein [Clostridia bacterium]
MKNENFFGKLASGFKDLFNEKGSVKLIIILLAAVFLIFLIPFIFIFSCGGSAEEKLETLYEDKVISASSAISEYNDTAITFFYPTDIYKYSENPDELWGDWFDGKALMAEGKFAIFPEFEYVSEAWNSVTETYATTVDEAFQNARDNAVSMRDPVGEFTFGEHTGIWREINGFIMLYLPVEHNPEVYVILNIVPFALDQNAEDKKEKAVELFYNEEVRAIIGAMKITSIADIPKTNKAQFYVYPNNDTIKADADVSWPKLGGTVYKVDKTVEYGPYKLYIDSIELTCNAKEESIVTYNLKFINNGTKTICADNAIGYYGYQNYSLDVIGTLTPAYVPVAPGRCIAYQESYVADNLEDSIYLETYEIIDNGDGTYSRGEERTIDIRIVE